MWYSLGKDENLHVGVQYSLGKNDNSGGQALPGLGPRLVLESMACGPNSTCKVWYSLGKDENHDVGVWYSLCKDENLDVGVQYSLGEDDNSGGQAFPGLGPRFVLQSMVGGPNKL